MLCFEPLTLTTQVMTLVSINSLLAFVLIEALANISVPGHFSAAGQVTYFNLWQADRINTLDP